MLRTGKTDKKSGFLDAVREFFTGFVVHEPAILALKEKVALERIMLLMLFGDMVGLPLMNHYFPLRLLPYMCRRIEGWKRALLRERDWTDWTFD